jgi:ribosomal protein S18 acetylase RimI-like enzyme
LTLVLATLPPPVLWPLLRRHLSVWESLRALVLLTSLGSSSPDSATAVIEAVAVLPQARGQGVGRALVRYAMDAARRTGRARVALYVVDGNDAATRLYESLGFRVTRRHRLLWHRWLFGARRLLYMVALLPS